MTNEEAAKVLERDKHWRHCTKFDCAECFVISDESLDAAADLAITALRTKHSIPAASGDCVINEHDVDPLGQQTYENGF